MSYTSISLTPARCSITQHNAIVNPFFEIFNLFCQANFSTIPFRIISHYVNTIYDSESGLVKILETVSVYQISENSLADGKLLEGGVFVSITVGDKTTEITRRYQGK
ncbi:MAG: hypothetical protein J6R49_01350 [Clostridia bacterium]|nr:hypothetical protein [Clostridia bacterium]